MAARTDCNKNALTRSECMIDAVLKDVMATYTQVGGGGITDIKLVATSTYTVSIAQEERIDQFTYELSVTNDGRVKIVSRKEGTVTPQQ